MIEEQMPVGIVMRRQPGVTRWQAVIWRAVAILPGAAPADWRLIRDEGDVAEYHAATLTLRLYSTDAEGYQANLGGRAPGIFVLCRPAAGGVAPITPTAVTASAYEAQDWMDAGDDPVERVPMPPAMTEWIAAFCQDHFHAEPFKKRRRDRARLDRAEAGKGDPRVQQTADVFRAPTVPRDRAETLAASQAIGQPWKRERPPREEPTDG